MKYEVSLKTDIEIEFENVGLIKEFFIEGDWGETFCPFDSLREVVDYIALNWNHRGQLEGLAVFETEDYCTWVSDGKEFYGKIYITRTEDEFVDDVYSPSEVTFL